MVKLWTGALLSEIAALAWLLSGSVQLQQLLLFFVLHGMASALIGLALLRLFPRSYRRPTRWVWAALAGTAFFVPLLGPATIALGIFGGRWFPQLLQASVFNHVAAPSYTSTRNYDLTRLRGGALRARLRTETAPAQQRAELLMALSNAPTVATGGLLRELLADPADDMRLLAYGLLDRRDKEIARKLSAERQLLVTAQEIGDRESEREICNRIGQLYWELVYQELAQGDMARYALEQALIFTERALREDSSDGPKWLLIARIRLRRGELKQADAALHAALAADLVRRRALPYLAELRFAQGRYDEVRSLMFELGALPGADTLVRLQRYWAA